MNLWGKIIGALAGYLLGGTLGALIGAVLGHFADRGFNNKPKPPKFTKLSAEDLIRIRSEFFTATFSVMGHVAKADGRDHESEAALAAEVMDRMGLPESSRKSAIKLFNTGKSPDFSLQRMVGHFYLDCRDQSHLLEMFIEIQIYAAFADGRLSPTEKQIIQSIAYQLDFSAADYARLESVIRAEFRSNLFKNQPKHKRYVGNNSHNDQGLEDDLGFRSMANYAVIEDAYAILNMPISASDEDIKMAYRRLTSQHHPDKLVARGLPKEMMKIAEEKTHEIRAAYDRIREIRNF